MMTGFAEHICGLSGLGFQCPACEVINMTMQDWAARKLAAIETYQAAIKVHQAADEHLSALLTAKYGKRAGDMRYRPAETVEIGEAMRAKLNASEAQQTAWLAYMRVPAERKGE